eukprot:gene9360-2583_t
MRIEASLCIASLCVASPGAATYSKNGNRPFVFGFWDQSSNHTNGAGNSNIRIINTTELPNAARSSLGDGSTTPFYNLLDVTSILWNVDNATGIVSLRPDYADAWAAVVPVYTA